MVEVFIVGLIVTWSAIVVFKKVFPTTATTVFTALSTRCAQAGWPTLAKWLKPAAASGCGGNCACPSDATETESSKTEVQMVKWK